MPFTLAHPAAVLPFHRHLGRAEASSALVVGSITPDLAYFLPFGVSGSYSHSLPGLLLFCLPVGALAWAVYLTTLRPFVVALLPSSFSKRLKPCTRPRWSRSLAVAVAVSVLVGAATHVVWDSFTHSTGFVVEAVPALSTPLHLFDWYTPRLFTVLQHISTLGGLTVLALFGLRWFRGTRPTGHVRARSLCLWPRLVVLGAVLLPSAVVGLRVLWLRLGDGQGLWPVLQNYLGRAIFSAGTVFLAMLLLFAVVWRAWDNWLEGAT